MKKTIILLCCIFMQFTWAQENINIIPKPNKISYQEGHFTLKHNTKFEYNTKLAKEAIDLFLEDIKPSTGYHFAPSLVKKVSNNTNTINFSLDKSLEEEAYKLTVTKENINISSSSKGGFYYALISLTQLLPTDIENNTILEYYHTWDLPAVTIEDSPRFSWRGLHIDVSRHFYPKNDILKLIDIMASYKLNKFHWHLIDEGGWRLEIKKFPEITEIGAWRNPESFKWGYKGSGRENMHFPLKDNPNAEVYGGYYTQEEVKEIVAYAAERNIITIPEIEMPGHILPVLSVYPHFGSHPDGGVYNLQDRRTPGISKEEYYKESRGYIQQNVADVGKPEVVNFFKNVLDEVFELFPSKYIHLGGDEVSKLFWENSKWVAELMKKENLKDQHEVQAHFMKTMANYLEKHDRKMIGWDEIVDGGLHKNTTIMFWRNKNRMLKALETGHEVVITPLGELYFDHGYAAHSVKSVYNFNPMPKEATSKEMQQNLIGAQACLWTENMQNWAKVEFQTLPRLLSLAEGTWTDLDKKDFKDFSKRLNEHYIRLENKGYNFRVPTPTSKVDFKVFKSSTELTFNKPANKDWVIRYTLDGSTPTITSNAYVNPITINKTVQVKASYFTRTNKSSEKPLVINLAKFTPKEELKVSKGLTANYKEGDFKKIDGFKDSKVLKTTTVKNLDLSIADKKDGFYIQFNGYINIETEDDYTFTLGSQDGAVLELANAEFINNDGKHKYQEKTKTIRLTKGYYPINIEFFNFKKKERLELKIKGSKGQKVTQYFH